MDDETEHFMRAHKLKGLSINYRGGNSGVSLRKQIRNSLHFLALNFIKLCKAQELTESRFDCKFEMLLFLRPSDAEISSTNFQIFVLWDITSRSLIITKKRIGPSLVPWGTPAFTGNQFEIDSPSLTHCRRFERKSIIHGTNDLLTPRSNSFNIKTL